MNTDPSLYFGSYTLVSAELLSLPTTVQPNDPRASDASITGVEYGPIRRQRLRRRYHPIGQQVPVGPPAPLPPPPLPPAPPPPPPISSVGIMDVGIANCNMLLNENNEPILLYDVGYPLWFFLGTLPNTMRAGNAAYLGPIVQNIAGNLEVMISHWDWDHWRLGRIAARAPGVPGLNDLRWTYPVQAVGPSITNFLATIALANRNVYGGAPFTALPNYTIYQCVMLPGNPPAMIQNNTGLALSFQTRLPTGDNAFHHVLLTADANVINVGAAVGGLHLTGILAVHHGSNANGAPLNLPVQTANYAGVGRIFFSYGVGAATGVHPYGFPVPAAILAWQAAGWTQIMSTAEAANMNAAPPNLAARGNIRVARNVALNVAYGGTAFVNFPNPIN